MKANYQNQHDEPQHMEAEQPSLPPSFCLYGLMLYTGCFLAA